ncbi:helix-hairpin-helix domain-containing protein [Rhodococcus tibetensis]|uniref:Helix-hairpin-helix domain-containing protein n=1 Tax=Rhodococcus tibetensis TaxID=2965064 RepID=A0ABT1QAT9_9NOCA|nr:helix-hairpin-helix domain-containing protein [Rhodococcus sp. FXJ9.536]MCQ4118813.1 helix-hairpin-helix domain-containing protein [Rhodococcus sp. FXJ9.536]
MGIREERSRGRSRLAFITSGEDTLHPSSAGTPPGPSTPGWLAPAEDTEPEDDTTWSAERRWSRALPERWRGARVDPGRAGAAVLVVVGLILATVAVISVRSGQPEAQAVPSLPFAQVRSETTSPADSTEAAPPHVPSTVDEIVVSVVGLVSAPGLVRLPPGSRVADALAAAGGVRSGGDTLALNLAQRLSDGDQVVVGVAAPEAPLSAVGGAESLEGAPVEGKPATGGLVDLNTATETELDALPGVGPVTAAAIVAWRTTNGKFTDIAQLGEVDGIGPVRLEKLRSQVTV